MELRREDIKKGSILVSEPFFSDPYFRRSVVLLIEHNPEGSLGFILNKPIDLKLNEALDDFPDFNAKVFFGGPVKRDNLYYIHTIGYKLEGSFEIANGVFWGGNFEQLKEMIRNKEVEPEQIRFFVGYSGWEGSQLKDEMKENTWLVAQNKVKYVMTKHSETLWSTVLKEMGTQYAILANFPEDPSLN